MDGTMLSPMAIRGFSTLSEVNSELQKLLGPDPYILELPHSVEGIIATLLHLRQRTVQVIAARLKATPPREVEEEQWKKLTAFLAALNGLETVDPRMKNQARLDLGLEAIFKPAHNFPLPYRRIAKSIFDKLEGENWGAEVEADNASEEEDAVGGEAANDDANIRGSSSAAKNKRGLLRDSDYPDNTDPIYGLNGIMHHILRIQGGNTTSYLIDPNYKSRNAKVFGHNGFTVGQCFPSQMSLLRDGAHGQKMGGISGSKTLGTYSIVVSGMYNDLDEDYGATIFYSGSNSHGNTSQIPLRTNNTIALERSIATQLPVRVFRSSKGRWNNAPSAGLRYDGLYKVVSMSIKKNGVGGAYQRFRLDRMLDQDNIKTNEPNPGLVRLFEQVARGYTRTRQRRVPIPAGL